MGLWDREVQAGPKEVGAQFNSDVKLKFSCFGGNSCFQKGKVT